jgi:flagellar assembly factor FliW
MKVSTETSPIELNAATAQQIRLPLGLIGFPDHRTFELLYATDQLPFVWMRLHGDPSIDFVVIEPGGLIPDYELELFDEDAAFLGIADASDAMVLNIVTVHPGVNATATVNLVGPVVINRRTGIAKQCVLANHGRFSAHYPLVDNSDNTAHQN